MATKIEGKIVSQKVLTAADKPVETIPIMNKEIKRGEILNGSTYKVKVPNDDNSMYITINNIEVGGKTYPFEIFANSRNMSQFQWIVALTRLISAVFRNGDSSFITEELKHVFDPRGGFYQKGTFHPSLVAKIGSIIEQHLVAIGIIQPVEMEAHVKAILAEKRAQFDALQGEKPEETLNFPEKAKLCPKCGVKAVVISEGCTLCLNCSDSKCG